MALAKWAVEWWESERGWGRKPIGSTSLFETKEEALQAIKEHWAKYPDGPAPDYYIFPEGPTLVEVDEDGNIKQ